MNALIPRTLLQTIALAAAAVAVVDAFVLSLTWSLGGLDTRGPFLDWGAVEALATVSGSVATVLAVGGLGYTGRELDARTAELRRQAENDRAARMPYLRADIGFLERPAPGFKSPTAGYVFTPADFGQPDIEAAFAPIA